MKKKRRPRIPQVRLDASTKSYYLEYYDIRSGKRERPRIGPRKDIAKLEASRIFDEMMDVYMGIEEKTFPDISIDQAIELYFQSIEGRVAPSTMRRYKTFSENFAQFMKEEFKTVTEMSKVRRIYVEELLEKQKRLGYKPKTLNNQIFIIKTLFNFAVSEGLHS